MDAPDPRPTTGCPRESEAAAAAPPVYDWTAIFQVHDRWLRRLVSARVQERQAVDEVMQEVALSAVAQRSPLLEPARLVGWLYRLAVRQALIYRRKAGRHRALVGRYAHHQGTGAQDAAPSPLGWLLHDERRSLVQQALSRLPPGDADLLVLKYAEGWSAREMAGRLGLKTAAVERGSTEHGSGSEPNLPPSLHPSPRRPKMPTHDADLDLPIQVLIDRMIDGEMSPQQLRMCIERLDAAPEGWRQCALAFLEAQSWGEAFRSLDDARREQGLAPGVFAGLVPAARAPLLTRGWVSTALAAGITLIAFSLGWMVHGLNVRGNHAVALDEAIPTNPAALALGGPENEPPRTPGPGSIAGLPTDRVPTVREVARLRLGTGDQASAEVPILAGPGIGGRWLLAQPPPVSEHDRAVWQRQGYQLEQRRQLVSVPLADGRRAAVPVDHVQVRYIGHDPL